MKTVEVTLNVPKESKEVVDAVDAILEDAQAKKGVGVIAAENLTGLMTAVEGFDQLDDEMKSAQRSDLAAYLTKVLLDRLAPVKEES